jgi:hypothetical protein
MLYNLETENAVKYTKIMEHYNHFIYGLYSIIS